MVKCKGKTLEGKKCKRNAIKGTMYCSVHGKKKEVDLSKGSSKKIITLHRSGCKLSPGRSFVISQTAGICQIGKDLNCKTCPNMIVHLADYEEY